MGLIRLLLALAVPLSHKPAASAHFFMMLVERPLDRWRQRRAQRALSLSTQAVTSIVVPSTVRASA